MLKLIWVPDTDFCVCLDVVDCPIQLICTWQSLKNTAGKSASLNVLLTTQLASKKFGLGIVFVNIFREPSVGNTIIGSFDSHAWLIPKWEKPWKSGETHIIWLVFSSGQNLIDRNRGTFES